MLVKRFVKNGDTEHRIIARAGDADGKHGAGTFFLEEGIERLQTKWISNRSWFGRAWPEDEDVQRSRGHLCEDA